MGVALALAFFGSSPQSRGFQMSMAQQVGLFPRCPTVSALVYVAKNVGDHTGADELLKAIRPRNKLGIRRALARLTRRYGKESKAMREAAEREIEKFLSPPAVAA